MIRFPDYVRKHAFHSAEEKAFHFEGRDFTWAAFNRRIHGISRALLDLGVKPGERVAYLGQNSHWLAEIYLAPSIIGAISVPMNYRLSEIEMIEILTDCAPTVLVCDRHFEVQAAALMAHCPSLEHLVHADWDGPGEALPPSTLRYEELVATHENVPDEAFDDIASESSDTMMIFYTSGTTGKPKGVMLSHANLAFNVISNSHLYGITEDDVILISGPLFHMGTGARVFTAILCAATMVIQSRFEVVEMMRLIETHKITTTTLVPTMLAMVLDHPDFDRRYFPSMRVLTYGSAPMPIALMERAIEAIPGLNFCQSYGATEASPVVSMLLPSDHLMGRGAPHKLDSVGKPLRHGDVRIMKEDGAYLPIGQVGEIVVRGPQIMNGYWNLPDETALALRGGFYHTGDAGYLDADGYLFLAGRTKEMIISGGENVYPIETENCLSKHPAVSEVVVIGLPHKKWGEEVHAVVRLITPTSASEQELIAFCRDRIAHYKAPRSVTFWDGPLPTSPTGKIDKMYLRKSLADYPAI